MCVPWLYVIEFSPLSSNVIAQSSQEGLQIEADPALRACFYFCCLLIRDLFFYRLNHNRTITSLFLRYIQRIIR